MKFFTVKPIEWETYELDDGYISSRAKTSLGDYEVWRLKANDSFRWEGPDRNGFKNGRSPYEFENIEAARSAAFEHYSERLNSLIDGALEFENEWGNPE